MFGQYFNGLPNDGLIKFTLRVDRIPPESSTNDADTNDSKISKTFEGPTKQLQHLANIIKTKPIRNYLN